MSRLAQRRTRCSRESARTPWLKFTGLSGEPTTSAPTVGSAIDVQSTGDAWQRQQSLGRTGLSSVHRTVSSVHRTVSGVPRGPRVQRLASPNKERNRALFMSGGAPDCPVRQWTEGKNCLPNRDPTAPSCLVAIKGTTRRMEHYTKHLLDILRCQDLTFTHSIHCVRDVSTFLS
jgi:hypothetical protein